MGAQARKLETFPARSRVLPSLPAPFLAPPPGAAEPEFLSA